jgi:6-pyruvoyltetrahydropterin/6-carboxytetrahydropterin synthase
LAPTRRYDRQLLATGHFMATPAARYGRIEIDKQAMNVSIAHFTIFSATEREDLHGHNFQVQCDLTAAVYENGLTFDYGIIKRLLKALCDGLDEKTVLPARSPYLTVNDEGDYIVATFNGERLPFLHRDVLILDVTNTTVEELSHHFLKRVVAADEMQNRDLASLTIKVSSSPGQTGAATWTAKDGFQ